jgi:hypothetical protein
VNSFWKRQWTCRKTDRAVCCTRQRNCDHFQIPYAHPVKFIILQQNARNPLQLLCYCNEETKPVVTATDSVVKPLSSPSLSLSLSHTHTHTHKRHLIWLANNTAEDGGRSFLGFIPNPGWIPCLVLRCSIRALSRISSQCNQQYGLRCFINVLHVRSIKWPSSGNISNTGTTMCVLLVTLASCHSPDSRI